MCANIDQSQLSLAELERRGLLREALRPRDDVYPRMPLGLVYRPDIGGALQAAVASWGLVPARVEDPAAFQRKWATYNARAESIATKNVFAEPFRRRRCAIPVDGFREWADRHPQLPKYRIAVYGTQPAALWLAGLWEQHPTLGLTCTVATCEPVPAILDHHSRMPVILGPHQVEDWIDRGGQDLLRPCDPAALGVLRWRPGLQADEVRQAGQGQAATRAESARLSQAMADSLRAGKPQDGQA